MKIYVPLMLPVVLAFIFVFVLQSHTKISLQCFTISGFAQGTTYHITYYAADSFITKKNIDSTLDKIDSSLSIYKSYSIISRFNRSTNGIDMDEHLSAVVRKSIEVSRETNGISDITVYPLVNAWGFGPEHVSGFPDSSKIKEMLKCVGAEKIHIKGNRLIKDLPCVKIDVNGIAQGYSVDVVANLLEKKNIGNYLVEIGGEIRIKGKKQPGEIPMQVGIEGPAMSNTSEPIIKKIIQPNDGAITTSGNYRKYYEKDGKHIAHLMDPKTGYPFQNEMISATVWAKDAITADGYDNALMGMGLEKAMLFLKKHKEMSAYFIFRKPDHSISDTATEDFYKFFKTANLGPAKD